MKHLLLLTLLLCGTAQAAQFAYYGEQTADATALNVLTARDIVNEHEHDDGNVHIIRLGDVMLRAAQIDEKTARKMIQVAHASRGIEDFNQRMTTRFPDEYAVFVDFLRARGHVE